MFNLSSLPAQHQHPYPPPPPPFPTPSLCFLVSKCLNQLHFLTLHLHTSHSTSLLLYSWLYAFFSSLCSSPYFRDNSLRFYGFLSAHFFPMSKAYITGSIFPTEHFQHFMPPTFATLLLLNFLNYNLTTSNSMLCSFQMFSPITFLNTAPTHLAIYVHILNIYY